MSAIKFNEIPEGLRVPGVFIEVDGSQASTDNAGIPAVLIVGLRNILGTAAPNEIISCSDLADGIAKAGAGSMLAGMLRKFYANNSFVRVFLLPVNSVAAAAKSSSTITFSGSPVENGTISLYIGGISVQVPVVAGATAQMIGASASNLVKASEPWLPVTTVVTTTASFTLTAKDAGICGDGIDIRLNYLQRQKTPSGLVVSINAMSGGTTEPSALVDVDFLSTLLETDKSGFMASSVKYMVIGFNSSAIVTAFSAIADKFYRAMRSSGFRIFMAISGSVSSVSAFSSDKNSPHIACLGHNSFLSPAWEVAAAVGSSAIPVIFSHPGLPLTDIPLTNIKAGSNWTIEQQNQLLYSGISTSYTAYDGTVYLSRVISTYRFRPNGTDDNAFLNINAAEAMDRIRYLQRVGANSVFDSCVVVSDDDFNYRPGLPIVTKDLVRAYLLERYKKKFISELGWCQNYEYYKDTLIVEDDPNNIGRIVYFDSPVLASPFYGISGRSQFRLSV